LEKRRQKKNNNKAEGCRRVNNYGKLYLNTIHPEANRSCLTFVSIKTVKSLMKLNYACSDVLSSLNKLLYELCGPSQNRHVIA